MAAPYIWQRVAEKLGVLASTQMTSEKPRANPEGNLFEPVTSDPGAHGRFDNRAAPHASAFPSGFVRGMILAAGLTTALAGLALARGRRAY